METHRIISGLLIAAEHRGEHATGFVAGTSPFRRPDARRIVIAKRPEPATSFIRHDPTWSALRHRRCSTFVGHCRWATHGSPSLAVNNHPHSSSKQGIHLVHNGVLLNHRALAEREGLRLRGQCDSEILLRLVERADDPVRGLLDCLRDCDGSMAVAVYDERRDVVLLARNSGRPLWVAKLPRDRRTFFASTDTILLGGLRSVFAGLKITDLALFAPVAERAIHVLTSDGRIRAHDA